MPKAFKYCQLNGSRVVAGSLALFLTACASQPPEIATPEPETAKPAQPTANTVADRSFDADTLYALLVAEIAGTRNRYDIAISNYVQQALATRDPGVTARAARIARLLNAHDAALEMALLWLELEPENIEAHFIAGAELARAGELVQAADHSAFLLERGEDGFFEAIAASAAQAEDTESVEQLKVRYDSLLQDYPQSASLHLGQSLLLHYSGQLKEALAAARRAKDLEAGSYQPALQEMRILQKMGRTEEAREGLARLVEQYPDDQRLRLQYARLLASSDLETAQKQFRTLVEQSPGDPDFTFSLALIQLERGLLGQAQDQLEALANGGQHSNSAHFYLGQIAESRGDVEEALYHYQQVTGGSDYLPAVMQATELFVNLGELPAALEYLRAERENGPIESRDGVYLLEAQLLNQLQQQEDALAVLNAGLEEFPQSVKLLYARAMLFTERDAIAQAEQDLKQIIELVPNNAAALNALGYTLADQTDRLDEAYGYIKAALDLEPNDAAILDSMGWVLYRMGDHDQALEYLEAAMATTTDDEIAAHLGEVLWVIGAKQEAREAWKKGLEANPESTLIRDTLERLDADLDER